MDYKEYNDYELIDYIQERNEEALEILIKKYKSLVEIIAKKKYSIAKSMNMDYADLYQEGLIGLMEAIRDYKENVNVKFYTFATICIERQINSALLKYNRKKNMPLNTSISLDTSFDDPNRTLIDIIDSKNISPEDYMIETEDELNLYNNIKDKLSTFEEQVFELKINNFTYEEIAKILSIDSKTVYNAMERIKNKVKKEMNGKIQE